MVERGRPAGGPAGAMAGERGAEWVAEWVRGLRPYEPGKPIEEVERELGVVGALKLASNENAWGTSPAALEAAKNALGRANLYPDAASWSLREALAARLGVGMGQLVIGNGSNELIGLLVRALVKPGQSVLSSAGSFIAYKLSTLGHGRRFVEAPLGEDLGYDLGALVAAADPTTKLVFIANPNNPTGTLLRRSALSRFFEELDRKCAGNADGAPVVVLDEAYLEYIEPGLEDVAEGLELFFARPRVVLLRTFSKAYGLAALRVGYAVCEAEIADYLNRVRDPFNVISVVQAAARAALMDEAWVRETVAETVSERARVTAALTAMGLGVTPSQANFVLIDLGAGPAGEGDVERDARAVSDLLMRRGVIARPMGPAGLPRHLRLTIGRPRDNDKALAALAVVLAGAAEGPA